MGLWWRISLLFSLIIFVSACQTRPKEAEVSGIRTPVSVEQLLALPILNDQNWLDRSKQANFKEANQADEGDGLSSSLKKRDWVMVTLSSFCPCSQSHMAHLNELAHRFPEFQFIGLHTDRVLEGPELKKFYQERQLSFPVLDDRKLTISSALRAVTTPHVFVLNSEARVLYQGAVTSASDFSPQNRLYLQEALQARASGQGFRPQQTRPLGCPISYNLKGGRG